MIKTPREIAAQLIAEDDDVVHVDNHLVGMLQESDQISELEALERLEALRPKVVLALNEHIRTCRQRGLHSKYEWIDDGVTLGRAPDPLAIPQVRDAVRRVLGRLTGDGFERVAQYLLGVYGAGWSQITGAAIAGGQGDRGIDVVGVIDGAAIPAQGRLRSLPIRVAIQAKRRYDGTITTEEVEAFASRLENLRKEGDIAARMPTWFRSRELPVVGLLMTCGRLTPAARRSASQTTILWIEGDQIVEDLARSPRLRDWIASSGTLDENRFLANFSPAAVG